MPVLPKEDIEGTLTRSLLQGVTANGKWIRGLGGSPSQTTDGNEPTAQKVISDLCPVKGVNGYSGEDRIDFWNKQKWDEELNKYQVIVMTSQILSDMLTHQYVHVSDINLLIFDECHHAIDDHPMRMVMKHFENCPEERQPRVLGLTATLLNANVNLQKVEESLLKLETTFHATIATVNELGEVLK